MTSLTSGGAPAHVNGKWLSRPVTGTGRYAQEVVRSLLAQSVPLVLHVPGDGKVPGWLGERCEIVRHRSTGVLFEQLELPLATHGRYLLNMGGPAPLLKRKQLVVMHDATPMRWPASYSRQFATWYRVMYTWFARTALHLVTVSDFSRGELAAVLQTPSARWTVAPCGHEHFSHLQARPPELPAGFDPSRPFLVCVGTLAVHKNLVGPATALANAGWQVLVVGTGGPSRVFASGVTKQLPDGLLLLGRIDDEELAWCYDNALALVFPSRYEGFGLPVVEAQSRGCPVVSSDAASLQEVLAGSGLLFEPDDHEQLLEHVNRLAEDEGARDELSRLGRANVHRYRWSDTAKVIAGLIPSSASWDPRGRLPERLVEWSREVRKLPSMRRTMESLIRGVVSVVPKHPDKVVVHGLNESEDGALAVLTALRERDLHPTRLTNGAADSPFRVSGVRYRSKYSFAGFWSFARASVVITSQALYGGLGGGPHQKTVLLWHGELVKPVGLLVGDRALAADVAPVCSSIARVYRMAEFGLQPSEVPVIGTPRNDRLMAADRAEIRKRLDWLPEKQIWLWLPTYRSAVRGERRREGQERWHGLPYSAEDVRHLDRLLTEQGLTLMLKPHPLAEQRLREESWSAVRVLAQADLESLGVSLHELMAAADGLVTDASSAWVDFLLLDKPMVFAFPDLDQYRADRGLNLEPYDAWVPGPVVSDVTELADLMGTASWDEGYKERRRSARLRFHRFRDANSANRLLDLLELPASSTGSGAASGPAPSGRRRRARALRRASK